MIVKGIILWPRVVARSLDLVNILDRRRLVALGVNTLGTNSLSVTRKASTRAGHKYLRPEDLRLFRVA
jgi:hypothetical protein